MTDGERRALVESSHDIEDALIDVEFHIENGEKSKTNYILRALLRAVRILIVDRLR